MRESYREGGKVKNRTIANLSHCKPAEIAAIELALRHKDNLAALGSVAEDVGLREGPSVGAVWTLNEVARRLGIDRALGPGRQGRLALWQVIARAVGQGSRLSAVRLARSHVALEVLGLHSAFDEDDLYANLAWLDNNQAAIEDSLFRARFASHPRARVETALKTVAARLDGCYAITTDLPVTAADARTIHERYKDLIEVEDAFRTCKTGHLKVRPIFVRSGQSTRGHVVVVMLAYLLVRELARLWRGIDVTVEEGIAQLATLSAMTVTVEKAGIELHKVPKPRDLSVRLLEAAGVTMPDFLPKRTADVVTKKSLAKARLNN
ncbi:MAG: hypothetical protein NTY46_11580 [Candidatus Sumerlaeota bacterium]|nr:hypothetical protein [Candidatus Sumerlaeota bacterium]